VFQVWFECRKASCGQGCIQSVASLKSVGLATWPASVLVRMGEVWQKRGEVQHGGRLSAWVGEVGVLA